MPDPVLQAKLGVVDELPTTFADASRAPVAYDPEFLVVRPATWMPARPGLADKAAGAGVGPETE